MIRIFWFLCFSLFVFGCAKRPKSSPESASYGGAPMPQSAPVAKAKAKRDYAPAMAPPPPPPPMELAYADDDGDYLEEEYMEEPSEPEPEKKPEPEKAARMVHYDGWAQIRTPRADDLIDEVIALAEAVEGTVENRYTTSLTIRVPVESFDETWKAVLKLGPVISRHLGAEDVTEAFRDASLRLKSQKAMRERLVELLAQAVSPEEKVQLLKEIHRLTDQIDVSEAQRRALADLAARSKITVTAVAPDHNASANTPLPYGQQWIDGLGAFSSYVPDGKKIDLEVPAGFVRLDKKKYLAQSADGAKVWAGIRKNNPVGTSAFWRKTISHRISEQFDDGSKSASGDWMLVRYVEQGSEEPYSWWIGVRTDGKDLHVFQAMFPSPEHEERYGKAVKAILGGGAS